VYIFFILSRSFLLRLWSVSDKSCRGNQNIHFVFSSFFPPQKNCAVYEIILKNIVEPDRPQMNIWRMRIECQIPKATNTHSKCVTFIAFPLQLYLLTPWSRVLLQKLTGLQLFDKFPAFYRTRMFITAFTSSRHLSLFRASSIQSIPSHHTSWRSILILSSHLLPGFPSGLFPSGFPTKTLYTPLPHTCYMPCPSHSSWFHHSHNIGWAVLIINPSYGCTGC